MVPYHSNTLSVSDDVKVTSLQSPQGWREWGIARSDTTRHSPTVSLPEMVSADKPLCKGSAAVLVWAAAQPNTAAYAIWPRGGNPGGMSSERIKGQNTEKQGGRRITRHVFLPFEFRQADRHTLLNLK